MVSNTNNPLTTETKKSKFIETNTRFEIRGEVRGRS